MAERDPRVDPKPGDSIIRSILSAKSGVIIREVTRAHGSFVFFEQDNGYTTKPRIQTLLEFRKWANKAEDCIRCAEDGTTGKDGK